MLNRVDKFGHIVTCYTNPRGAIHTNPRDS